MREFLERLRWVRRGRASKASFSMFMSTLLCRSSRFSVGVFSKVWRARRVRLFFVSERERRAGVFFSSRFIRSLYRLFSDKFRDNTCGRGFRLLVFSAVFIVRRLWVRLMCFRWGRVWKIFGWRKLILLVFRFR